MNKNEPVIFGIFSVLSDQGKLLIQGKNPSVLSVQLVQCVPLTSSCCFHRHWQQLDCFFFEGVYRLFELLLIPETDDRLGLKAGERDAGVGALGGILTDHLADLPRSAFLQLGEDAGLERQWGHPEEKLDHVFA